MDFETMTQNFKCEGCYQCETCESLLRLLFIKSQSQTLQTFKDDGDKQHMITLQKKVRTAECILGKAPAPIQDAYNNLQTLQSDPDYKQHFLSKELIFITVRIKGDIKDDTSSPNYVLQTLQTAQKVFLKKDLTSVFFGIECNAYLLKPQPSYKGLHFHLGFRRPIGRAGSKSQIIQSFYNLFKLYTSGKNMVDHRIYPFDDPSNGFERKKDYVCGIKDDSEKQASIDATKIMRNKLNLQDIYEK